MPVAFSVLAKQAIMTGAGYFAFPQMSSSATLFISGSPPVVSSVVPLHVHSGDTRCETLNLFIASDPPSVYGDSVALSIYGSTSNAMIGAITLFVGGTPLSESLGLFIFGKDSGGTSSILRMYIAGSSYTTSNSTSLFIQNDTQAGNGSVPLFIQGDGISPGYIPYSSILGMYVERGNSGGVTMFIQNNGVVNSLPIFIVGAQPISSSTPLYIRGLGDAINSTVTMYVSGAVPQSLTGSVALSIPNVSSQETETVTMYVNGFNY